MRLATRRALPLGAAFLGACAALATRTPPKPTSTEHGMLAARLVLRGALIRRFSDEADNGLVVQLDAAGRPREGPAAASGYAKNGYFYFFDLPPGRYALVSASFAARGTRYRVLLPPESLDKRAVELKPGEAAFLGRYDLDGRWPGGGEAFLRAARLVGRWVTPWVSRKAMPRDADFRGFEKGPAEEGKAMLAAREDLAGTLWRPLAVARVKRLGTPEPAATDGSWREKPLPLRQEPLFAWRDLLGWGEPIRTPNGLEWREEGGARAAVYFTSASAPGFLGYEAAVRQLRAGGSVEDVGGLDEVKVSTRAGWAGRVTRYRYPEDTLTGSKTVVEVTETVLVPDGEGMYTARLRAEKARFEEVEPLFRRFLAQLVLGKPPPKAPPKQETLIIYTQ